MLRCGAIGRNEPNSGFTTIRWADFGMNYQYHYFDSFSAPESSLHYRGALEKSILRLTNLLLAKPVFQRWF